MNNKNWTDILKRASCIFIFCGHKLMQKNNGHKQCVRCGEKFFNAARVVHKHKRLRHNKWGKKFY